MEINTSPGPSLPGSPRHADKDQSLWKVAQNLESNFLSEMLKTAGLGKTRDALGGGAGEDHFSTFLAREYADATVRAGGIGLSEAIYTALAAREASAK